MTEETKSWMPTLVVVIVGAVLFIIRAWQWIPVWLSNLLVLLTGLFLILLVLIQRGKGGGLAGAFGGAGGSSPFGSRAGDTFTRFTINVALVWFLMIIFQVKGMQPPPLLPAPPGPSQVGPASPN
ncbi:MAG: preprotein translocase subunit SecG [Gemmataceae bacterium]|nr:preprotein translocase subunit SecG [Gemmataceae bacterium]MDW8265918.1 preprotein translocase subunit SecG [Gemmataceae bacterium]